VSRLSQTGWQAEILSGTNVVTVQQTYKKRSAQVVCTCFHVEEAIASVVGKVQKMKKRNSCWIKKNTSVQLC